MKKTNTQTLGEAIQEYIKALKIGAQIQEASVVNYWSELLGPLFAKATTNIYFKDGKLFVSLNSSVIRNELLMMKSQIIEKLNKRAGTNVVKDIIFR